MGSNPTATAHKHPSDLRKRGQGVFCSLHVQRDSLRSAPDETAAALNSPARIPRWGPAMALSTGTEPQPSSPLTQQWSPIAVDDLRDVIRKGSPGCPDRTPPAMGSRITRGTEYADLGGECFLERAGTFVPPAALSVSSSGSAAGSSFRLRRSHDGLTCTGGGFSGGTRSGNHCRTISCFPTGPEEDNVSSLFRSSARRGATPGQSGFPGRIRSRDAEPPRPVDVLSAWSIRPGRSAVEWYGTRGARWGRIAMVREPCASLWRLLRSAGPATARSVSVNTVPLRRVGGPGGSPVPSGAVPEPTTYRWSSPGRGRRTSRPCRPSATTSL